MQTIIVKRLTTEGAVNPLGLGERIPRLGWQIEPVDPVRRGVRQSAWRVLVSSDHRLLERNEGDLWDSGRVASDQSVHVEYAGAPLRSGTVCHWKVAVWDERGACSAWSDAALWSMGLLERQDWEGQWIDAGTPLPYGDAHPTLQASPYFRKSFTVSKPVARAFLYATALGVYELHLDGHRFGQDRLAPGWTDYRKRVQTQTYDVTSSMKPGHHAIGAILGTGWFAGHVGWAWERYYGQYPSLLLQLCIEYVDGTQETVKSDDTWKWSVGPIQYSDIMMGELYDATCELAQWSLASCDDGEWRPVHVREPYTGMLVPQVDPPVRSTEELAPISVNPITEDAYILDFGQNISGHIRFSLVEPRGTRVMVRHGEMLNPDGTLYTENLRGAKPIDIYVAGGHGNAEIFEPHFTFHGFRYAEVSGLTHAPLPDDIRAVVVHSDTPSSGTVETDDHLINRLWQNTLWGQRGNFLSVPTDCPNRDERLGWAGDAQVFVRTASYNMDVSRFFAKWMGDMADAQLCNGAYNDIAPDVDFVEWHRKMGWCFDDSNPGWGDAGVIVPWTLYLMYGDVRLLRRHYAGMKRWIGHLDRTSKDGIREAYLVNYGDWLSIDADTPKEIVATAYFAYSVKLFATIADILEEKNDVALYGEMFERNRRAFRQSYVQDDGKVLGDTQTGYLLALHVGLLEVGEQELALAHLLRNIQERNDHLSTGFLGVSYLLPVLSRFGRDDMAYRLLEQKTYPSWLYSVLNGATTIWERWDGWTEKDGFQNPGMNSFNHYSLGSVGEWMFRFMAGIEADLKEPGFRHTVISPHPGGSVRHCRASYRSAYGEIVSHWEKDGEVGQFVLNLTIPANTTATLRFPVAQGQVENVVESGKKAIGGEGIEYLGWNSGRASFRFGSGKYQFAVNSEDAGQSV